MVRQAALLTDLSPHGVSRGRLGAVEIFRMSTDWPSLAARENPPILGVDECGTVSKKILCIKCVYMCGYLYVYAFF